MAAKMLSTVPVGPKVRLIPIQGGRKLTRRLVALGISQGNELEVLHHRSGGVMVGKDGNRVALGAGVADKLVIEVLTDGVL